LINGVTPSTGGSVLGLQLPVTIVRLTGFFDSNGNVPNLAASADRAVDLEGSSGFGTAPTLTDARMLANLVSSDFAEPGDSFSVDFSETMNLNPTGFVTIRDGDGTLATIACGSVAGCAWNGTITKMSVTLLAVLPSVGGFSPGLQVPLTLVSMSGIAEGNPVTAEALVPDLPSSTDVRIDFE
jgi:hypothetical protein